jgi:hypothetical protein
MIVLLCVDHFLAPPPQRATAEVNLSEHIVLAFE